MKGASNKVSRVRCGRRPCEFVASFTIYGGAAALGFAALSTGEMWAKQLANEGLWSQAWCLWPKAGLHRLIPARR